MTNKYSRKPSSRIKHFFNSLPDESEMHEIINASPSKSIFIHITKKLSQSPDFNRDEYLEKIYDFFNKAATYAINQGREFSSGERCICAAVENLGLSDEETKKIEENGGLIVPKDSEASFQKAIETGIKRGKMALQRLHRHEF